jgi:hypothetical protein
MSQGPPRPTSSGGSDSGLAPRLYRELDRVRLRHDLPEHGLKRGEEGTIVHSFGAAHAYLVEFVDPADGSTRAEVEVSADAIAPVGDDRGRRELRRRRQSAPASASRRS